MNPENPTAGRLVLEGPATVRTIEPIHARLTELLAGHDAIEVDCAAVTEADLSLVQLLLAARRSAARDGKILSMTAPASSALHQALTVGGFLSADGDPRDPDAAFWLKGRDGR